MTLQEIEQKVNEKPVVVTYFSHDECNVCKVLRPQVKDMVERFTQADFVYVNTKESPEASGQHMVFAVPTIIVFYEGREARRFSRHFSMQDFKALMERMVE